VKIWLVGAQGMLGQAVADRLEQAKLPVVATDLEVDIGDSEAVEAHVAAGPITHIINCAAYTAVDRAEDEAVLARRVNVEGPRHLAAAAAECSASLLHVSTDYVFDGRAREPYREDSPCAPAGVYARTKHEGELAVLASMPEPGSSRRTYVLRTSWLFGEGGNNFVTTMLRLMGEKQQLRVVADQWGRPTYTRDLAEAILRLLGIDPGHDRPAADSGVYHFANLGATTWHDFASAILEVGRRQGRPLVTEVVTPISTSEYPLAASRPGYSVLATDKIEAALGYRSRPWEEALRDYLEHIPP
jgi:dTDP-4-dehydrorhamnose reductase